MRQTVNVNVVGQIPQYAHENDSGCDIKSAENVVIPKGKTVLVKTGMRVSMPDWVEMQIRPRSGLSLKTGLRVANSPGTVDSNYRNEVCVICQNTGDLDLEIKEGDRIAQAVFIPTIKANFIPCDSLDVTERKSGFGSTGT